MSAIAYICMEGLGLLGAPHGSRGAHRNKPAHGAAGSGCRGHRRVERNRTRDRAAAGRSIRRSIEASYDRFHDFQRTMQLNYFGAVKLLLAVLPGMRSRRRGHIINISSIGVQAFPPRFGAYVASKSALAALSRCIAPEVVDDGVAITNIHMPLVRTPMIAPTGMYQNFPTSPPEERA